MIPATTNFNEKVDDGVTPQNLIISFDAGLTLSSDNGDFTSQGVTIIREMGGGEDFSFGEFPSSVLSFSAYNYNNRFSNFAWGKCTVSVECDGETVPIGVFNVEKPAKVMTQIVNVTDAYDNAKKLDVEITEYMRSITYPIAIKDLYYGVLTYCGIEYHTFPTSGFHGTYSVADNPLGETGACSARQMLKWVGEFCMFNARVAEDGKVRFQRASTSTTAYKTYGDTKIASNGFEIAEFQTAVPNKLIVRNAAGLSYVDGSGDNIYTITANPWYQDLTMISLTDIANKIPVYHPATYNVIEADPCIECGDLISFTLNGVTNTMPIMSQTIRFAGRKTSAIYGSTGNAIRSNDEEIANLDYSINVANNTGNIINAIYAHGIDADYITTGKITDRDGNYSLDLETGTVNMANANITGGNLSIDTESLSSDAIKLNFTRQWQDFKYEYHNSMTSNANEVSVDIYSDANGYEGRNSTMQGSSGFSVKQMGDNVVYLNLEGLEFYKRNGDGTSTITATYPADNKPVLIFDSGYMPAGSSTWADKALTQPYTNFRFVLITCGYYGSVSTTILEPVSLFASHASNGNRIDIHAGSGGSNTLNHRTSIYVTGPSSIKLGLYSYSQYYEVRIYGIY